MRDLTDYLSCNLTDYSLLYLLFMDGLWHPH